jgi:hypothetical protein
MTGGEIKFGSAYGRTGKRAVMRKRKDSNPGRNTTGRRHKRGLALLLALAMTIQQSSVLSLAQDQEPLHTQETAYAAGGDNQEAPASAEGAGQESLASTNGEKPESLTAAESGNRDAGSIADSGTQGTLPDSTGTALPDGQGADGAADGGAANGGAANGGAENAVPENVLPTNTLAENGEILGDETEADEENTQVVEDNGESGTKRDPGKIKGLFDDQNPAYKEDIEDAIPGSGMKEESIENADIGSGTEEEGHENADIGSGTEEKGHEEIVGDDQAEDDSPLEPAGNPEADDLLVDEKEGSSEVLSGGSDLSDIEILGFDTDDGTLEESGAGAGLSQIVKEQGTGAQPAMEAEPGSETETETELETETATETETEAETETELQPDSGFGHEEHGGSEDGSAADTASLPSREFTGSAGTVEVLVSAPEGAFPEGTRMQVKPVYRQSILSDIEAAASEDFVEVQEVYAVDISFWLDGQEIEPLIRIPDSFRKIVVVKDYIKPWKDEKGIQYVGIEDFLLGDIIS